MKFRRIAPALTLAALTLTGACAYYNSMYNANRLFEDAEKAAQRGDLSAARTAWQQSMEKAATSLSRHPDSRWSDDARLLMARAHLHLGDPLAAQTRLQELLDQGADAQRHAVAELYLGVIAAELGDDSTALVRLNAALAGGNLPAEPRADGLLARGRIHLRAADWQQAQADARAARAKATEPVRVASLFLDLRAAFAGRDSASAAEAWRQLLRQSQAQRWPDSLRVFAVQSAQTFSAGFAQVALAGASQAPWRASARDSLLLVRAELMLDGGDLDGALQGAQMVVARSAGAMADAARVRSAEWRLARCNNLEELTRIRNDLLPAIADGRARAMVQALRTIDVLTESSRISSQPLGLFAAAELARDELNAPMLAAQLFQEYATRAPQSDWSAKALLAAGVLDPAHSNELRARAEGLADNPYVAVLQGRDADVAYQTAEERLSRNLQAVLSEAALVAVQRESNVNRAAAVIDSLRIVARTDSTRVVCTAMMDTLAVSGIRADSIRAACMRGDNPRIGVLLKIDTLTLRDSTRIRIDSLARARRIRRDTTFP